MTDEIVDDLADLSLVHIDGLKILGNGELGGQSGPMHGELGPVLEKRRKLDGFLDGRAAAGKGQKFAGQFACAHRSFLGFLQCAAHGLGGTITQVRQGDVAENHRQDVVEIMGDAAGEQADRFELAGFLPFRLGLESFRDVAKDEHRADGLTQVVEDRCGGFRDVALIAVAGDQQGRMVLADDDAGGNGLAQQTGVGLAGLLVEGAIHFGQRAAHRVGLKPASQLFGDGVEEDDATFRIGGDDPVTNGAQGDAE